MTLQHEEKIYTNRRRIYSSIEKHGLEVIKKDAIQNVIDLATMIFWNKNHGIDVTRISSELVTHATDPRIIEQFGEEGIKYTQFEFLRKYLKQVGDVARAEKIRLTFHTTHFVQIASPDEDVFQKSVNELAMYARYFSMMEMGEECIVVVHMGGTYGNKKETIQRFKKRFRMLPEDVQKRLVLENDEKNYDALEVLEVCEELKVPMVFDIFHYYCYPKYNKDSIIIQASIDSLMPRILETWNRNGVKIRPKFHLSEQKPFASVGTHSIYVEEIPIEFLEIPSKYGVEIDIMLEAKGKEVAIGHLYNKYPQLQPPYVKPLPETIPAMALKDMKLTVIDATPSKKIIRVK